MHRLTTARTRLLLIALATAVPCAMAARGTDTTAKDTAVPPSTDAGPATTSAGAHDGAHPSNRVRVAVRGTTLAVHVRGEGRPLLLIHGGGEDAGMLAAQAQSLAEAGYRVVTYDRRGTGDSGRENWPGDGADQHADDAAALIEALDLSPATVVGVSSGGVLALNVAARHPEQVSRVIAWEAPALGMLPGGADINAGLMAPIDNHLRRHPGDFVGAQAELLSMILGFPVSVDDPAFAAARANAEPMIRDEPSIPLKEFGPDDFSGVDVTVALGSKPLDFMETAAQKISHWTGRSTVRVEGEHQVYLADPSVLTEVVMAGR